MEKQIVVGFIRASHGLTGKMKVESTSGESEHFADYTEITLRLGETEKTYTVESIEGSLDSQSSVLFMKLKGIDSSEAAKNLAGSYIIMPKDKACPLYKDEYYISDLCQCALIYTGEQKDSKPLCVGRITGVLEGGDGSLFEVEISESMLLEQTAVCENSCNEGVLKNRIFSKQKKTILIPFRKEFIGKVDIIKKTVELLHLWILD